MFSGVILCTNETRAAGSSSQNPHLSSRLSFCFNCCSLLSSPGNCLFLGSKVHCLLPSPPPQHFKLKHRASRPAVVPEWHSKLCYLCLILLLDLCSWEPYCLCLLSWWLLMQSSQADIRLPGQADICLPGPGCFFSVIFWKGASHLFPADHLWVKWSRQVIKRWLHPSTTYYC